MNGRILLLGAVLVAGSPAAVLAHHSFAMFDDKKEVTIVGTVKDFQWTNPHVWTQLLVDNGKGGTDEWGIEGISPNSLARKGWSRATFKPGEKITLVINPLKSGEKGGAFVRATKEDGSVVTNATAKKP
jgi:hypothetical protein